MAIEGSWLEQTVIASTNSCKESTTHPNLLIRASHSRSRENATRIDEMCGSHTRTTIALSSVGIMGFMDIDMGHRMRSMGQVQRELGSDGGVKKG